MDDFDRGYEFVALEGIGSLHGMDSAEWLNKVESSIRELYSAMGSYDHYKANTVAQRSLKGFIAEEWAYGTANVDAAVKGLPLEGSRLNSHDLGSADVAFGNDLYQLKYFSNPKVMARELATTLQDSYSSRAKRYQNLSFDEWARLEGFEGKAPSDLLYDGMWKLVPTDKLEEVRAYTLKRIIRAQSRGLDAEVRRWTKVRDGLTDRIRTANGVEGRPATNSEMMDKAIKISNGEKLDPADDAMTTRQLVRNEMVLRNALKAGASAAAVSAALKVAPEIYRAIDYLIEEGELDDEHLQAIGMAACDGAATGFVTGSATAAITAAAERGVFGETVKAAALGAKGANVIAALVVMTVETCRDSYMVASGRMKPVEMAQGLGQSLFATVCMFAGLGVASVLAPEAAVPALIGSLVGSAVGCFAFKSGSSCIMRVCADSGFTFFGLVEKDERIPAKLLRKLDIKGARVKTLRLAQPNLKTARIADPHIKTVTPHSIDIAFNEQGLIGIRRLGL